MRKGGFTMEFGLRLFMATTRIHPAVSDRCLKLVNQRQPDMALERCARVLWMVGWMPQLTDGRETKWFTQEAFSAVLAVQSPGGLDLLKQLSRSTARWKMQDCLEEYLLSLMTGDPEYLGCFSESFANNFSDDGRHCKQIMELGSTSLISFVHPVQRMSKKPSGSLQALRSDRDYS